MSLPGPDLKQPKPERRQDGWSCRQKLQAWPQYSGRLQPDGSGRPAIHVPVFQYFVLWTAFYMLRGPQGDSGSLQQHSHGSRRSYAGALGPTLGSAGVCLTPHPKSLGQSLFFPLKR